MLIGHGLKAQSWVAHVQNLMNGKGGGKDGSAQATGTNTGCLEQAVKMSKEFADAKLKTESTENKTHVGSTKKPEKEKSGGKESKKDSVCKNQTSGGGGSLDEILNDHLAGRSYIEGYEPSQADTSVFRSLNGKPPAKFVHLLRWYNHIKSYGSEVEKFPGKRRGLSELGFLPGAKPEPAKEEPKKDDDFDLFGSDDDNEDAEAERVKAERLKAYEEKKKNKVQIIAKSNIILDVKPWDDETDMGKIEEAVRSIVADGLLWGASKLVPLAYGIKKLQISCVVEDDKVGTDFLEEEITKFEELVQSVDIAAFNKI